MLSHNCKKKYLIKEIKKYKISLSIINFGKNESLRKVARVSATNVHLKKLIIEKKLGGFLFFFFLNDRNELPYTSQQF